MNKWIIDSSHGSLEDKEAFLKKHANYNVIMDLTCFDPHYFYNLYPQLKGVFSALLSLNQKCEAHFRELKTEGMSVLQSAGFEPFESNFLNPGFVVARTMATIINEAFYTLEDEVANQQDIDSAMKFGVNYPAGPFEWAKGREAVIVELLKTLFGQTKNTRYQPNSKLIQKSLELD
jgi:3-hydroxybutyryl-CoA dehydrogenase